MENLTWTKTREGIVVTGKTYDVKGVLKKAGATWSSPSWIFRNREDIHAIQDEIRADVNKAVAAAKAAAQAEKAHQKWLKTPEGKKYLVQQALQQGINWICCEDCEVVSWGRQSTYCQRHTEGGNGFRIRGCIYTGD
jgi:hypothetical protein